MADQEASIQSIDNAPNQVSVGLAITPSSKVISYLLNPLKVGGVACASEPNPDYLPLVGVRTRRLGELYPYADLQGYRAGNEVTVVAYMQGKDKDIPPPARVIAYMDSNPFTPIACSLMGDNTGYAITVGNGNLIVGVDNHGTIGFSRVFPVRQPGDWGLIFNGQELFVDNTVSFGTGRASKVWEYTFSNGSIDNVAHVEMEHQHSLTFFPGSPSRAITAQYPFRSNRVGQFISVDNTKNPYGNNNSVEPCSNYIVSDDNILTIVTSFTNTSPVAIDEFYYMDYIFLSVDRNFIPVGTNNHENISDDISLVEGDSSGLTVAFVSKSSIAHKSRQFVTISTGPAKELFNDAPSITLIGIGDGDGFSGVTFYIPTIAPDESIEIVSHMVFATSKAEALAKANAL